MKRRGKKMGYGGTGGNRCRCIIGSVTKCVVERVRGESVHS